MKEVMVHDYCLKAPLESKETLFLPIKSFQASFNNTWVLERRKELR